MTDADAARSAITFVARLVISFAVLACSGCTDDTSTTELPQPARPDVQDAARKTLAAGPARLTATVRAGRVFYRLRGRWDPTRGYRVCARIEEAPSRYLRRRVLSLDGRNDELNYGPGTLTAHGAECRKRSPWFDDHTPTLELCGPHRLPGAEDYLHRALLALIRLPREPPRRNIDVRIGRDGYVERVRLRGRVRVELTLSRFGEARRIPLVVAYAIE